MKVKCIKNGCIFTELGEVFEVEKETVYGYVVNTNFGKLLVWKFDFEIVKEDKMENRIVRKLEDLCNMGNGMGLYIDSNLDVRLKDKKMQICCGSDFVNTNLGVYLEVLKSMGFKFEYKPLRTEQEVKREILSLESLHFAQEKPNYYVGYNNLIDKYLVICDSVNGHGLHIYMTEEQAKKYADELNEIIGVGK